MNPLTNMKNVKKLSEQELTNLSKSSWHDMYRDSAWIFVGGLPYELTEGDVICIFSQYGEVVNINLVRDKATGKQKGFCFLCYEDQRSTVLAVDNFNGIKILGRTIRVDHVLDYKMPKEFENITEELLQLRETGCAFPVKIKKEKQSPERNSNTTDSQIPDIKPKKEKVKKEKSKKVKKEKSKKVKKEKKKKSKKSVKGKKDKKKSKKDSDKSKKKHKKKKVSSSESESDESSTASSSSSATSSDSD